MKMDSLLESAIEEAKAGLAEGGFQLVPFWLITIKL